MSIHLLILYFSDLLSSFLLVFYAVRSLHVLHTHDLIFVRDRLRAEIEVVHNFNQTNNNKIHYSSKLFTELVIRAYFMDLESKVLLKVGVFPLLGLFERCRRYGLFTRGSKELLYLRLPIDHVHVLRRVAIVTSVALSHLRYQISLT